MDDIRPLSFEYLARPAVRLLFLRSASVAESPTKVAPPSCRSLALGSNPARRQLAALALVLRGVALPLGQ